ILFCCFFFSSRRRHTRFSRDWSSDVCSSDLLVWRLIMFTPSTTAVPFDGDTRSTLPRAPRFLPVSTTTVSFFLILDFAMTTSDRSEERRVGKEGRCGRVGCYRGGGRGW